VVQQSQKQNMKLPQCVYADALTKVLALSKEAHHPCFAKFSAQVIRIAL
jgi:thiamine biosynthesis lipoprotein